METFTEETLVQGELFPEIQINSLVSVIDEDDEYYGLVGVVRSDEDIMKRVLVEFYNQQESVAKDWYQRDELQLINRVPEETVS